MNNITNGYAKESQLCLSLFVSLLLFLKKLIMNHKI